MNEWIAIETIIELVRKDSIRLCESVNPWMCVLASVFATVLCNIIRRRNYFGRFFVSASRRSLQFYIQMNSWLVLPWIAFIIRITSIGRGIFGTIWMVFFFIFFRCSRFASSEYEHDWCVWSMMCSKIALSRFAFILIERQPTMENNTQQKYEKYSSPVFFSSFRYSTVQSSSSWYSSPSLSIGNNIWQNCNYNASCWINYLLSLSFFLSLDRQSRV